jgi:DNA-directed RNA polymerase specialized sigma24 family protein
MPATPAYRADSEVHPPAVPAALPLPLPHQSKTAATSTFNDPAPMVGRRVGDAQSTLAIVETRFALLNGDRDFRIDGTAVAGLANEWMPPVAVRRLLLDRATPFGTRDAALQWLLAQLRGSGGDWPIVLTGMLLPGLRRVLGAPCRRNPMLSADIEAEAFTGLLVAAGRVAPDADRVAAHLTWAARRAADRYLRIETAQQLEPFDWADDGLQLLRPVTSHFALHCDVVLADAVSEGVLPGEDAELIIQTRLEGRPLAVVADQLGVTYAAASKRRHRAETALRGWLRSRLPSAPSGLQPDGGFVTDPTPARDSFSGGRPRHGRRPDRRSGVRQPTTIMEVS